MQSSRTRYLRRIAVTGTVALAASAGLFGLAPASAADKPGSTPDAGSEPAKPGGRAGLNGVCESNELCLYYLQDRVGAKLDLYLSDANFSNNILRGGGSGNGATADNNTRSFLSTEASLYWRVYDGANYTGTEILCIAPGDRGNFTRSLWDRASSARYSSTRC